MTGIVDYLKMGGRVGGQTFFGGTENGEDITICTTDADVKGSYIFPDIGAAGFVKNSNMGVLTGGYNETYYLAASATATAGVLAAGSTYDDMWSLSDGNFYEVAEVAATPGFDIEVAFSGVSSFDTIVCRVAYNGVVTHWVGLEVYNYSGAGAWVPIGLIPHSSIYYQYYNFKIPSSANYVDSGAAKIRFYHYSAGDAAHDIYIDYAALIDSLR